MAAALLLALVAPTMAASSVLAAPPPAEGWTSNSSYTISYLGRDGPNGADHYHVEVGWGASFFAIAVETMPLLPAEQSVALVMEGYRAAFPGRPLEDLKPGDEFEFYVPGGTLVSTQWRQGRGVREFRSLRGDTLLLYTDPTSLFNYRLSRVEDPAKVEVAIDPDAELNPYQLAQKLFGADDPDFQPDFLQVQRARDAIEKSSATVVVDSTRAHLDDLRETRRSGQPGGKSEEGLDIYWYRSEEVAQPILRIDDSVGESTDLASLPSIVRVYYYKDGVVRTYRRAGDTLFLAGRQPRNDTWAKVYAEFGRTDPAPTRWELGQPEQDAAAEELKKLGIVVLRYRPKEPPQGNFFTRLLDSLMAMMNRKEGGEQGPKAT